MAGTDSPAVHQPLKDRAAAIEVSTESRASSLVSSGPKVV